MASHLTSCSNKEQRRRWNPTPVLLPAKSHGWRSLVGCSAWGREESDPTEQLHFHFSLSCIGEGNGNPLQCSCLENLRDRGAWWAAIYGVTQSWIQLKQLSSSSNQQNECPIQSALNTTPQIQLVPPHTGQKGECDGEFAKVDDGGLNQPGFYKFYKF